MLLDNDGWCSGLSDFYSEGQWFHSAYQEVHFKLYLTRVAATIARNSEGNPVLAIGRNDPVAAKFHLGFIHDRSLGM